MSDYYAASSSSLGYTHFKRSPSIRSEEALDLRGPLEVTGNVESERGINLEGEIIVTGSLDAYGPLTMNGSISCEYVPSASPLDYPLFSSQHITALNRKNLHTP